MAFVLGSASSSRTRRSIWASMACRCSSGRLMEERIVIRIDAPSLPQISKRPAFRHVAAYARVSTSSEEQLNSVEAQKSYYKEYIGRHKEWIFAGLYTDEGISGLSYLRRDGFNLMINDAYAGKIDLIVTKSISREHQAGQGEVYRENRRCCGDDHGTRPRHPVRERYGRKRV